MQNSYRFPQPDYYYVNPVYRLQLGFIADGKDCIVKIGIPYTMNKLQE